MPIRCPLPGRAVSQLFPADRRASNRSHRACRSFLGTAFRGNGPGKVNRAGKRCASGKVFREWRSGGQPAALFRVPPSLAVSLTDGAPCATLRFWRADTPSHGGSPVPRRGPAARSLNAWCAVAECAPPDLRRKPVASERSAADRTRSRYALDLEPCWKSEIREPHANARPQDSASFGQRQ